MASTPTPPATRTASAIYGRLLRYLRPYRAIGAFAVLGMLIEAAAAGVFTTMMEPVVQQGFIEKRADAVTWLPLAIVALFLVRGLATFVTDYGMARIGRGVVQTLRGEVLSKYLRLPSSHYDRETVAVSVARLTYNTEQVAQAASDAIKVSITDVLTITALLVAMLIQSVQVTIAVLILTPIIAMIVATVGRRYRRINRSIQASVGEMSHVATETLAGQQVIKVHAAQAQAQQRFDALADRNRRLQVKVEATKAISSALVQLLGAIALAVILYIAGREAIQDRLTAGQFVALMTSMMAMLPSLKRITNVQGMIQKGVAAAGTLFDVLDAEPEADRGTQPLARARGEIVFRDVGVRYDADRPPALDGISFVARPGTVTAIVGRSGSGKSSLVRLLPRFYQPSSGEITLDGVPLDALTLADLRRQIALVSQHIVLFDDTIAANIAFGADAPTDEAAIRAAAAAANALEFIERLPQGFDTRVGEAGGLLSGGQRQRIAIARAILKNAPILILDEATSSLDSESERLIQDALDRIMRERTTLVIAHRLSTVEHADQVIVLDHGKLVEQGTHAELIARGGRYAQLHSHQFRDEDA